MPESVINALEQRAVSIHDIIELRHSEEGSRLITTPGRVVFNHEVREALDAPPTGLPPALK